MSATPAPEPAERRHAVVLCTELRGLAHVAEVLDPGVVLSMLSDFLNFAVEAIAANDGETNHESAPPANTAANAPAAP